MKFVKTFAAVFLAFATQCEAVADDSVAVSATPRYPWNGKVDVRFTINGVDGSKYAASFCARDVAGGTNLPMRTICKDDGSAADASRELLLPGTYNWVWNATADLGEDAVLNRVRVDVSAENTEFPYTVAFNANGGAGKMADKAFKYGTAQALPANAFTRTGYIFLGWATSATGANVYSNKQSVNNLTTTPGATVTLYAVWIEKGCVQLWEGGPYWAECNVGASQPEGYGYYFWWGDTVGYKRDKYGSSWVSAKNGASFEFTPDNCPTYGKSDAQLQSDGWIDAMGDLEAAHDAATVHLGAPWRIPTDADWGDLVDHCDTEWTTRNGVYGRIFKGRGNYASKSIFLPFAGFGSSYSIQNKTSYGYYWSATPSPDNSSCAGEFSLSTSGFSQSNGRRNCGHSVRPLRDCPGSYTVKFDANGGTGTMADEAVTLGTAWTLPANAFTRKDWLFWGWATSATGEKAYDDMQSVKNLARTLDATTTLYAVWTANYTVKFDANGGTGTMADETFSIWTAQTLTANAFTRPGYFFLGWATSATGEKAYYDKQRVRNLTMTPCATVTLYAVWKPLQWEGTPPEVIYGYYGDKNLDIFTVDSIDDLPDTCYADALPAELFLMESHETDDYVLSITKVDSASNVGTPIVNYPDSSTVFVLVKASTNCKAQVDWGAGNWGTFTGAYKRFDRFATDGTKTITLAGEAYNIYAMWANFSNGAPIRVVGK